MLVFTVFALPRNVTFCPLVYERDSVRSTSVLSSVVVERPTTRYCVSVPRRCTRSSARVPFRRSPVNPSSGRHSTLVDRLVGVVLFAYSVVELRLYTVRSLGLLNRCLSPIASGRRP